MKGGRFDGAENVKNPELKKIFLNGAKHCTEAAAELQAEVTRLGGKPEQSGSFAGSVHRRWVDVKSAVTGSDEASVLVKENVCAAARLPIAPFGAYNMTSRPLTFGVSESTDGACTPLAGSPLISSATTVTPVDN